MNSSPLEIYIETKSVLKANELGYLTPKMSKVLRGYPDRMFLNMHGFHMYIEFKRKDEEAYPLQRYWIIELRRRHVLVFIVDNLYDAILIIEELKDVKLRPVGTQELSGKGYTLDASASGGWIIS